MMFDDVFTLFAGPLGFGVLAKHFQGNTLLYVAFMSPLSTVDE
jgi:hypothetical protein